MEDKDKRAREETAKAETPTQPPKQDDSLKTPVERLYDKIPLNYRQVDIMVKVLIGVLVLVLILGFIKGNS